MWCDGALRAIVNHELSVEGFCAFGSEDGHACGLVFSCLL